MLCLVDWMHGFKFGCASWLKGSILVDGASRLAEPAPEERG